MPVRLFQYAPIRTVILLACVTFAMVMSACSSDVKEVAPTPTQAVRETTAPRPTAAPQAQAPTPVPATPTPAPPPPTPITPKLIGQPVVLTSEREGTRFSITVNAMRDPAQSTNQFNIAKGRWVLVDWTIRNEGDKNISFSTSSLKLLTTDDFEIESGIFTGFAGPELAYSPTLGPTQAVRGFRAYDVPLGAQVKTAIYHPSGSPQFTIADIK